MHEVRTRVFHLFILSCENNNKPHDILQQVERINDPIKTNIFATMLNKLPSSVAEQLIRIFSIQKRGRNVS